MRTDLSGRGIINILAADQLILKPRLYSSFLLWLLSELFENLPEVGDLEKPKLVFFFDEAHLLFDDAPPALQQRVEQVVRLIRSKGVGVYFCSQFPDDVPNDILGQLGNRIQHALRAYTPRDQKAVRTAAETFVGNPKLDVAEVISSWRSARRWCRRCRKSGVPMPVERTLISAAALPHGRDHRRGARGRARTQSRRREVRHGGQSRVGVRDSEAGDGVRRAPVASARPDRRQRPDAAPERAAKPARSQNRRRGERFSVGHEAAAGHGRDDGQAGRAHRGQPARPADSSRRARRHSRGDEALTGIRTPHVAGSTENAARRTSHVARRTS